MILLLVGSFCSSATATVGNYTEFGIDRDWQFCNPADDKWLPAMIPGCVHSDLINNGVIEDPYFRTNAQKVYWIDAVDWVYQTDFVAPEELLKKDNLRLVFECIDTYADIYLNDSLILSADNYFLRWEVDCKGVLKPGQNRLRIQFYAATKMGIERLENSDHPLKKISRTEVLTGALNEKTVNAFTRKPGYQFGWDWTDRFISVGIREPVFIQAWDDAKIEDVHIVQQSVEEEKAQFVATLQIAADREISGQLAVADVTDQVILAQQTIKLARGLNDVEVKFTIENPKLWWTNGLGDPNLYELSFQLSANNQLLSETTDRIGIRTLRLVRDPDPLGTSFYFELNGVPVYMKGANYIPNDNFLDRFTDDKYRKTIQSAVDANMNMLRIWGGGIYEKDIFYDLCDENGILVWQDFMFGGGIYPAEGHYLESVKEEVKQQVVRLRNHPCIALWCGNNETYEALDHWGWDAVFSKEDYASIWDDYYLLFNEVIPEIQKEYDPTRDYWPSSPLSDWDKVSNWDGFAGDIHYWEIWFFNAPFEKVNTRHGRFNSEFGFQSFPEMNTIKTFSMPEDWALDSEVMKHRQKSYVGNQQIKTYMEMYYKYPSSFEHFVYLSQVLQAFGVKTGIEIQRKNMPICMGSLYWQFNDCWPAISWSSLDYYLRWKALHYFVRDAYKPIIVTPEILDELVNIYVVSDKPEALESTLSLRLMSFEGEELWRNEQNIIIAPNTSKAYFSIAKDELVGAYDEKNTLLLAEITHANGSIDQSILYFVRPKDLLLPEAEIDISLQKSGDRYSLVLNSDKLCKNVYLSLKDGEGFFSDNYFDLLPGIPKSVSLDLDENSNISLDDIRYLTLKEGME